MKEVVTLQCGPASNHQGQHFWKYVQQDQFLFSGERPRLLALDWKPHLSWGNSHETSVLETWQGEVVTQQVEAIDSWLIDFPWQLTPKNIVGLHPEVSALEETEDKIRLLVEACDLLQGYHFLGDTALGRLDYDIAACLNDLSPKLPVLHVSLRTGTLADEALLVNSLSDLSTVLQLPCADAGQPLISIALDCLSLAYREYQTDMTDFLRPVMPWAQGNLGDLRMMTSNGEQSFGPGGALFSVVSNSCLYSHEDPVFGLTGQVEAAIATSEGLEQYLASLLGHSTLEQQQNLRTLSERLTAWALA
jgi:hypothetical protein